MREWRFLTLRLRTETYEKFKELIDKEDKSMSKVIRKWIEEYIKEKEEEQK